MAHAIQRKFRETLWFKKGHEDAEAARLAAENPEGGVTAADLLPIEDRYCDDGSLTMQDTWQFGVRTGQTQAIQTIAIEPGELHAAQLIREMKAGRIPVVAAMAGGVLAIACAILLFL